LADEDPAAADAPYTTPPLPLPDDDCWWKREAAAASLVGGFFVSFLSFFSLLSALSFFIKLNMAASPAHANNNGKKRENKRK
jgi:hypothetical protein